MIDCDFGNRENTNNRLIKITDMSCFQDLVLTRSQ